MQRPRLSHPPEPFLCGPAAEAAPSDAHSPPMGDAGVAARLDNTAGLNKWGRPTRNMPRNPLWSTSRQSTVVVRNFCGTVQGSWNSPRQLLEPRRSLPSPLGNVKRQTPATFGSFAQIGRRRNRNARLLVVRLVCRPRFGSHRSCPAELCCGRWGGLGGCRVGVATERLAPHKPKPTLVHNRGVRIAFSIARVRCPSTEPRPMFDRLP